MFTRGYTRRRLWFSFTLVGLINIRRLCTRFISNFHLVHHDVLSQWAWIWSKVSNDLVLSPSDGLGLVYIISLLTESCRLNRQFTPPKATLKEIHDAVPKHLLTSEQLRSVNVKWTNHLGPQKITRNQAYTCLETSSLPSFSIDSRTASHLGPKAISQDTSHRAGRNPS